MTSPAPPGLHQISPGPVVPALAPQVAGGAGFAGLLADLFAHGPAAAAVAPRPTAAVAPAASPVAQASTATPVVAQASAATPVAHAGKLDTKPTPHHARAQAADVATSAMATGLPASVAAPQPVPVPPPAPTPLDPAVPDAAEAVARQSVVFGSAPTGPIGTMPAKTAPPQAMAGPTAPVAAATMTTDAVAAAAAPARVALSLTPESGDPIAASPAASLAALPSAALAPPAPVPSQVPAPSAASAVPAPAAASAPASLAHQLSPALVQLAHGPAGNAVTLRLDPAGLGHVQVRIDRDAAGLPSVQVTAEHPDTLRLLVADQPQLHRALDSAGVAADGRTLSFALATTDGGASGSAGDGSAGGQNGGNGRPGRAPTSYAGTDEEGAAATFPGWLRAGVDITA